MGVLNTFLKRVMSPRTGDTPKRRRGFTSFRLQGPGSGSEQILGYPRRLEDRGVDTALLMCPEDVLRIPDDVGTSMLSWLEHVRAMGVRLHQELLHGVQLLLELAHLLSGHDRLRDKLVMHQDVQFSCLAFGFCAQSVLPVVIAPGPEPWHPERPVAEWKEVRPPELILRHVALGQCAVRAVL